MATKKNTNAEAVEQFIDALESYSTQLMDTVINMTDQNGNTALHYAVSNENFDVISVLLDSKVCRIDQMNTAGYSTLMLGALCELRNETESAIMQRLFHMGNVNAKAVKHAQTALMLAASHGRIEATNLLLKCGADVNIQDVDGSTALMCAAEHGQKEIDNQTALSIAVENHYRDIGVLIYAHLNFSRSTEVASTSNSSSTTQT
uniref:ANK_REP_REGION domain-containing protein n=1 Tax=Meloidogyne floridensis TaxID=298350 RepID=A0A915NFR4_9BILA